jgi:hypothetical protein
VQAPVLTIRICRRFNFLRDLTPHDDLGRERCSVIGQLCQRERCVLGDVACLIVYETLKHGTIAFRFGRTERLREPRSGIGVEQSLTVYLFGEDARRHVRESLVAD